MKFVGSYLEDGVLVRVLKTYAAKPAARTFRKGSAKNSRPFKVGGSKPQTVKSSNIFS